MSLKYIILIVIIYSTYYVNADCEPEWDDYNGERCFKHFPGYLLNYQAALEHCKQQGDDATLITIHSQNDQDYLSDLLFTKHKIVDPIWIGGKVDKKVMIWIDGTKVDYENWAPGKPTNLTDECVQMDSETPNMGKWVDEPCNKNNLVVCQKMQTWSLKHIQQVLLDNQKRLDTLEANSVPVGFIYVQLPGQSDPKNIWPKLTWENVTPKYAGLFFRAEGGQSGVFENGTQAEGAPRLIQVAYYQGYEYATSRIDIIPGTESKHLWTGTDTTGSDPYSISFLVSNVEVRPQNQAIRIWKRIK